MAGIDEAEAPASLGSAFETKKHISFLLRCLRLLPQPYTSADDQRMTLGYFAVSGLDLLGATGKIASDEKTDLLDWVYEQQCPHGGFRGGPSTPFPSTSTNTAGGGANVAMTYAALLILAVLRDDFSRLNRSALLQFVGDLQDKNGRGGFAAEVPQPHEAERGLVERDPRFTYCAMAICSMLGEWSTIDVAAARTYLEGCQRFDGGFGASEAHESHSGMTYCCIAALNLLPPTGTESVTWQRKEDAISWLAHRQVAPSSAHLSQQSPSAPATRDQDEVDSDAGSEEEEEEVELAGGFQGRPSKLPPDVCYSFWNGAALTLLSQHELVDAEADARYVLSAQSKVGGIAKIPDDPPDLLHTYLGLASLSLHQAEITLGLKQLDAAWNCSTDASDWIKAHLHQ